MLNFHKVSYLFWTTLYYLLPTAISLYTINRTSQVSLMRPEKNVRNLYVELQRVRQVPLDSSGVGEDCSNGRSTFQLSQHALSFNSNFPTPSAFCNQQNLTSWRSGMQICYTKYIILKRKRCKREKQILYIYLIISSCHMEIYMNGKFD